MFMNYNSHELRPLAMMAEAKANCSPWTFAGSQFGKPWFIPVKANWCHSFPPMKTGLSPFCFSPDCCLVPDLPFEILSNIASYTGSARLAHSLMHALDRVASLPEQLCLENDVPRLNAVGKGHTVLPFGHASLSESNRKWPECLRSITGTSLNGTHEKCACQMCLCTPPTLFVMSLLRGHKRSKNPLWTGLNYLFQTRFIKLTEVCKKKKKNL